MAPIPFDDRDGLIWFDGQFVPWRDAKLHVLTHGLHYASGVFEGERAYSGHIFKLREHTERLFQSARILGFEIPYTMEEIDAACIETMRRNNLTEAYIRPIAYRGSEMLAVSAQQTRIHVAIAAWAWPNLFGEDRMKGITLGMAKWRRPSPETAPTASKASGLYMIGTMSKRDAEAEGFNDALMLDWKGDVAEATGANAFFVFDGELHTPKPVGFLDGITRRTVMNLARQNQIKVVERTIALEEIARASEVFLAGTAAEVTPVRRIADHHYAPGRITEMLVGEYARLVRMSPEEVLQRAA
ncbi:branched-chain amino acid aminotransferase [Roseomonas xinghualingensis]|uniref:branched-chain amino acid aminotransferase n=1 Tax=Roseomonas xinghualingensis TaxID=2986475 RepID=UPI0021F17DD5|nr:branched-chain amino acid aminotransferase [Roseomonas sp. SXEYE001]MCV4207023.1 branched-chain amino acid aminotransferase [Roseomonas sp. SXEYE001]